MNLPTPKLLVVEDRPELHRLLSKILLGPSGRESQPVELVAASEIPAALEWLARERVALVLCDLEREGLDLIRAAKRIQPSTLFVLASASIDTAMEALRLGAYDSASKPFDPEHLRAVVLRALGRARSLGDDPVGSGPENGELLPGVVGRSPVMHALAERVRELASTHAGELSNILVTGETGTGKRAIARALHALGERSERPFITLDSTTIPAEQLESELFGHVEGAFRGANQDRPGLIEQAEGGTLLLANLAELPARVQAKLVRVLEQRCVRRLGETRDRAIDVRWIGATHLDLEAMVREGSFRAELWRHLAGVQLHVPALRERREDIPLLARRCLTELADKRPGAAHELSPAAIASLRAASWPGNLRELQTTLEHAASLARGDQLELDDLPPRLRVASEDELDEDAARADPARAELTWQQAIDHARDQMAPSYLRSLLTSSQGNVVAAANRAGIERESFYRLLRKYGVRADEFRGRG